MKAIDNDILLRVVYLVGCIVCILMVLLGGVWPTLYTLIAVIVLPAIFIFIWAIFQPRKFLSTHRLKIYALFSVLISIAAWTYQAWWMLKYMVTK